jgi:hypothetical protein
MKFMTTWSIPAAHLQTAQQRFVDKGGLYGEVKLLGQWHSTNGVNGWSLVESDSATALRPEVHLGYNTSEFQLGDGLAYIIEPGTQFEQGHLDLILQLPRTESEHPAP